MMSRVNSNSSHEKDIMSTVGETHFQRCLTLLKQQIHSSSVLGRRPYATSYHMETSGFELCKPSVHSQSTWRRASRPGTSPGSSKGAQSSQATAIAGSKQMAAYQTQLFASADLMMSFFCTNDPRSLLNCFSTDLQLFVAITKQFQNCHYNKFSLVLHFWEIVLILNVTSGRCFLMNYNELIFWR